MLAAGRVLRPSTDRHGNQVIDQDGAEQKEDVDRVPLRIEDDRHEGQPGNDRPAAVTAEQVEAHHGNGQKDEEKREGGKEHKGGYSLSDVPAGRDGSRHYGALFRIDEGHTVCEGEGDGG